MLDQDFPRSISREMSIQQTGAETLVYDECRHQAFCLNSTSSVVWHMCDGAHTVQQIAHEIAATQMTSASEEVVLLAIQDLRRHGLIEPATSLLPVSKVSRRTLIGKLSAGAVFMLPLVSVIMAPAAAQAYNGGVFSGDERLSEEPDTFNAPDSPALRPGVLPEAR